MSAEGDTSDQERIVVVQESLTVSEQCDRLVNDTAQSLVSILHGQEGVSDHVDSFLSNLTANIKSILENENRPSTSSHTNEPTASSVVSSGVNGGANFSDYSDTEPESPSLPQIKHSKPFFRRFSFKNLSKSKALQFFHKQESDETELATSSQPQTSVQKINGEKKQKLSKIVVECQKEGLVNLIADVTMDGNSKWEKSKMVLVKSSGGYMLEFFCPPKMSRPKTGVFCFLLSEARETTALEMPDKENTFVLKTENQQEYIVEAPDSIELRAWLSAIHLCMRGHRPGSGDPRNLALSHKIFGGGIHESQSMQHFSSGASRLDFLNSVPPQPVSLSDLPPRIAGAMHNSSGANGDMAGSDMFPRLSEYPWFHGLLSRTDAAAMVLHQSITGHGVFLVRQSETRRGEYVLTFNFQGRAKHIRMAINADGQCRVQHMWFSSIFDMLEHFRVHSLPLESGASSDCTLTEYAVRTDSIPGNHPANGQLNDRGVERLPEPNEVLEVKFANRYDVGICKLIKMFV